ncbi:hypothetical protein [Solidesulfovibrio sp.]|uniref:hypothetical protein n=1 Tax=Solidesulfovibrio sp. TaxID=2910990 RepID=UPI002634C86A|nr:hypothetical protein [Solidesulfovibrio sp.]
MVLSDRRAEKRVQPPQDAVLDFALWPAPAFPPIRLPLAELGPPASRGLPGQHLVLADAAPLGLGLRLSAPPDVVAALTASPALFVYLKLRDYGDAGVALSLFLHAATMRSQPEEGGGRFGLRIAHLGRGSNFEKSIELLDVSRFGVKELAAWTDAVSRHGQRLDAGQDDGLDLDALLAEPALAGPAPQTEKGNGS